MRKYWVAFLLEVQKFMEYRADLVIYSFANIFTPLMGLALWLVVAQSNQNLGLSQGEIIRYFLIAGIMEVVTVTWGRYDTARAINNGDFAKYQIKPFGLLGHTLSNNLGEKIYQLGIVFVTIGLVSWIFNAQVQMGLLYDPMRIMLFIISAIMALMIKILIDLMLGLAFIWMHDIEVLEAFNGILSGILSGVIIPIVLLPNYLLGLAMWLPYRYILSFSVELLTGKLSGQALWMGFGLQAGWCVLIYIMYRIVYKMALRSYQGYGV